VNRKRDVESAKESSSLEEIADGAGLHESVAGLPRDGRRRSIWSLEREQSPWKDRLLNNLATDCGSTDSQAEKGLEGGCASGSVVKVDFSNEMSI